MIDADTVTTGQTRRRGAATRRILPDEDLNQFSKNFFSMLTKTEGEISVVVSEERVFNHGRASPLDNPVV